MPNPEMNLSVALEENLALKAVCATLLAEIALLDSDPAMKLAKMTAGLQGMAHGVSTDLGGTTLTKTIDLVCTLAETALVEVRK